MTLVTTGVKPTDDYQTCYRKQNPEKVILGRAKYRAKKKGVPFNLELEDIVIPARCPVLDIPLMVNEGGAHSACHSPSLDRIDPEKGYVKGNVIVISTKANRIKNDATPEELLKVASFYLVRGDNQ